jgi:hypothetical protein
MFFIGVLMHYAFHYTEWASPEVAEANRGVSPLKALRRSKAVSGRENGMPMCTQMHLGVISLLELLLM